MKLKGQPVKQPFKMPMKPMMPGMMKGVKPKKDVTRGMIVKGFGKKAVKPVQRSLKRRLLAK